MLGLARLRSWFVAQERAVQVALLLAVATRTWFAFADHSVFWPDEIYQSIEPAHRLAFGYGLLPWEFRDGARSWAFPALLALPLRVLALFGVKSALGYVVVARLVMVALAVWGVGVGVEYARRLGGKSAALIAAFALAVFPPLLVYSHRTLQESASVPLVLVTPLLLLDRSRKAAVWAGLAIGLATLLRFQCALVAGVFAVALIVQRREGQLTAYIRAGAAVAAAGGLLDWFTWGRPFHSFITYVQFNLIRSGASTFGVSPPDYFLKTLWTSSGVMVLPIAVGFLVAGVRARAAALAVLLFIGLHSAIPHKEFRFILPVLPLMLSLGAVGLVRLAERKQPAPLWIPAALALLLTLGFAKSARGARYQDLGQYLGTPRASDSVWDTEEEPNLLLADASKAPDLCGMLMLGVRAAFTGGYSYLHRDVPLLYRFQACDTAKSANYVIAERNDPNVPAEFQLVRGRNRFGLFRRPGTCEPPPADFTDMLDGSEDMGLTRAPIRQPNVHELRINAGSSAAAFVRGWSNGEHLECRSARWAADTSARMVFPLQPTGANYTLSFTAQPYAPALPQAARLTLNGKHLGDFALPEGLFGYQVLVPANYLRLGQNILDFGFAHAVRAQGNDTRRLAALFEQITLAPAETSVNVDVGAAEGRRYLASGFSGDETDGARTFAWSEGPRSSLSFTLNDASAPTVLQVLALAYHAVAPVDVNIEVNGRPAGTINVPRDWARRSVLVPPGALEVGANRIDLSPVTTAKPSEQEPGSKDDRQLAVAYDRVLVAGLPVDLKVEFGKPEAEPFLGDGWSQPERRGSQPMLWNDGPASRIRFVAPRSRAESSVLRFVAQGYPPALPVTVSAWVAGKKLGEVAIEAARATYEIRVPALTFTAGVNELELRYSKTARPRDAEPPNNDARELAARFERLELVTASDSDAVEPP